MEHSRAARRGPGAAADPPALKRPRQRRGKLSHKKEVTLQQGMLTGDVAKKQHDIADQTVQWFLDDSK